MSPIAPVTVSEDTAAPSPLAPPPVRHDPIRVVLIDDHGITREGTRHILERRGDIAVVGESDRGDDALDLVLAVEPDLVVLDIFLPGRSGIDVCAELAARCPRARVLAFSAFGDPEYVEAMMAAGAAGYLLKTARAEMLVNAVRAVHSGSLVFDVAVSRPARRRAEDDLGASLTAREVEVVQLLAEGLSNQQLAGRLGISRRTVEGHLHHIFEKCGVSSRTEVLLFAQRHHLAPSPGTVPPPRATTW